MKQYNTSDFVQPAKVVLIADAEAYAEERVQREREEIVKELNEAKFQTVEPWLAKRTAREVFSSVLAIIRSRGEQKLKVGICHSCGTYFGIDEAGEVSREAWESLKPGKIARLAHDSDWPSLIARILDKLNELIDAENARRG
jgi:hypothetical protein